MLFGQITNVNDRNNFNIETNSLEGGFFCGSRKAIIDYTKLFYDIHDKRLRENLFIGKDQTIINFITYKLDKFKCVFLRTWELHNCNSNKNNIIFDVWFFYQQYLSQINSFNCDFNKRLSILTNL